MTGHTRWAEVKATRQAAGRMAPSPRAGDDWTSGWTIERMAAVFTPKAAARIKYRAIVMHLAADPESRSYADRLMREDAGHQWFCFCLDAVARRA